MHHLQARETDAALLTLPGSFALVSTFEVLHFWIIFTNELWDDYSSQFTQCHHVTSDIQHCPPVLVVDFYIHWRVHGRTITSILIQVYFLLLFSVLLSNVFIYGFIFRVFIFYVLKIMVG